MGAAVLSLMLTAAGGVAADAQPSDGICTVTITLPTQAQPGSTFRMDLTEDDDCASVQNPQSFTYGGLITKRGMTADDGIRFTHTIGSGDAVYYGIAPASEYWNVWIGGTGVQGAELVTNMMLVTTASAAPPVTQAPVTTTPVQTAAPVAALPKPGAKPLPPKTKRFSNCTAVHRYFSGGIARVGVDRDKRRGRPASALKGRVRHSTVAYRANKDLDRDGDGVACEQR